MTQKYEKHVVADSDFTDQLEAWSTEQTHLEMTIHQPDHSHVTVRGRITDIFAKDHVDHFRVTNGQEFRIDQITSVKELKLHT